ncbi:MAG: transposase, partial [Deinococcota bacterium]
MRQAALQLFNDTWKVDLIRLEKAGKFPGLSDGVHGVHLIVLYSCCGDLPLSRSDLAWQRH